MTFGEMLSKLRFSVDVEIRNKHNEKVCESNSAYWGLEPYLEIEVVEWFPNSFNCRGTRFTVFLDIEESENTIWAKRRKEEMEGEDE